ncbi:hypothetical protein HK096_008246 [Nowakowskiella sp. JEL0078]|nr:hypothetical protein HK096_008246 [Nowakowskiella sp. JEL0078]
MSPKSEFHAENNILLQNLASAKFKNELLCLQSPNAIFDSLPTNDDVLTESCSTNAFLFADILSSPFDFGSNFNLPLDLPDTSTEIYSHESNHSLKLFDDLLSNCNESAAIPCYAYQSLNSPIQPFSPWTPATPVYSPLSIQSPPDSPTFDFNSPLSVQQYSDSPVFQNIDHAKFDMMDNISTKIFKEQLGLSNDYQSIYSASKDCVNQTGIDQNKINQYIIAESDNILTDNIKCCQEVSAEIIAILSNDSMRRSLLNIVQNPEALNLLNIVVSKLQNENKTSNVNQRTSPLETSLPNPHIVQTSNKTLIQTTSTHNRKAQKEFLCPHCSRIFTRRFNYQIHVDTHQPNRVRNHICDECPKSFVRIHDLQRHKRIHTNPDMFTCPAYCGKTFSRKDALNRHLALKGENH